MKNVESWRNEAKPRERKRERERERGRQTERDVHKERLSKIENRKRICKTKTEKERKN